VRDRFRAAHRERPSKRQGARRNTALLVAVGVVAMAATALVPASAATAVEVAPTIRATAPLTGTVTGKVTVTGAPRGFSPAYAGVGGCQGAVVAICPSPRYTLASGSAYTFTLPVGTWHLEGFYELAPFGGAFLGTTSTVAVLAGKTATANFTVPYEAPGSVKGAVSVTNIPPGITVSNEAALACPSYAPYTGGTSTPIECADGYSATGSGEYSITTLPPGKWILYPSYVTQFGQTTSTKGTDVTVVSGAIRTVNLTTRYLPPPSGIVRGTATATGAPSGFADPIEVLACKGSSVSLSCLNLQVVPTNGASYRVTLAPGTWSLAALYDPQPYGGLQIGLARTVTVVAGTIVTQSLTVRYNTPGTADGLVSVTGLPSKVTVLSYTVLACPVGSPYTGDSSDPQCAGEWSGVSNLLADGSGARFEVGGGSHSGFTAAGVTSSTYRMSIPSGKWLLYPGYTTVYGPTVSTTGTPVAIAANTTVTENLTVAYRAPTYGALTGTVRLLNAPSNGPGILGVEACPSPPPTTPGGVCQYGTSQIGPNGTYQLGVPAGTWWVAEVYWYAVPQPPFGTSYEPLAGPAQKIVVKAGTSHVVNLSAAYGAT
jgi:hypothetical protein